MIIVTILMPPPLPTNGHSSAGALVISMFIVTLLLTITVIIVTPLVLPLISARGPPSSGVGVTTVLISSLLSADGPPSSGVGGVGKGVHEHFRFAGVPHCAAGPGPLCFPDAKAGQSKSAQHSLIEQGLLFGCLKWGSFKEDIDIGVDIDMYRGRCRYRYLCFGVKVSSGQWYRSSYGVALIVLK